MHELILWSDFFGAWLLVAGPLYQAAQELDEEEVDRSVLEGFRRDQALTTSRRRGGGCSRGRSRVVHEQGHRLVLRRCQCLSHRPQGDLRAGRGSRVAHRRLLVLVVVMFAIAAVNTAVRMSRTHQLVTAE